MGLRGLHANRLRIESRARLKPRPKPRVESAVVTPGPTGSARLRQQRHRQRARDGRIVLQVELPEAETIELLTEAGCLDVQRDYFSRQDIAAGIERFLSLARNA